MGSFDDMVATMRRFLTLLAVLAFGTPLALGDTLTEVRLGYFPNLTHAQAVLGVSSGDFQTALGNDIQLTPKKFNAGPALIAALMGGDIDIAYVGPGPALTAWAGSHGKEIRVVAGAAANGVVIVARQGSGITKMEDLVGKRIATPQHNNTQDISARHYVTSVLNQDDDRNVVAIENSQQSGRMLAGDIDAAWVPEPWGSRLVAEAHGTIIGEEKDLWPNHEFTLTVIIVRQSFLEEHPDIVQKILAVNHDWTHKLATHPQDYVQQLSDALFDLTHARMSNAVISQAISHVEFTDDPIEGTFPIMAQWMLDLGVVRQPIDVDGLVDTSILHKLQ
jgi:NitT/TauT family transport system substrate-binding protein